MIADDAPDVPVVTLATSEERGISAENILIQLTNEGNDYQFRKIEGKIRFQNM